MAMNTISTAARNAACDGYVDQVDTGTGTSHIRIYAAGFTPLLAELDFPATAFGDAATGVATAGTIVDEGAAPDTGTAAVCRIVDKDDATVWEGTVGTSGADINLNTVSITTDDIVAISSMTVTVPAGP